MSSAVRIAAPRRALAAMIVATVLSALTISPTAAAGAAPARDRAISPKALAFHDAMRALWESHGTWTLGAMKTMMRVHLDHVVALAVDQLQGHYAAAVQLYDVYIGHILDMADMLSTGIMQQFPARFR